jgi:hypothetical protein
LRKERKKYVNKGTEKKKTSDLFMKRRVVFFCMWPPAMQRLFAFYNLERFNALLLLLLLLVLLLMFGRLSELRRLPDTFIWDIYY